MEWLDYAKAIGITLVVVAHVIGGLKEELVGPGIREYSAPLFYIYTFHMPLFFAISGYLFSYFPQRSNGPFVRSTLIGIVIPYVLWSVIYVAVQNAIPGATNNVAGVGSLLTIAWSPILHLWFLYVLLFVRTIYYVALRLGGTWAAGAFGVACLLLYGLQVQGTIDIGQGPMGGALFGFGMLLARCPEPSLRRLSRIAAPLTAIVWLSSAVALDASPASLLAVLTALAGTTMVLSLSLLLPAPVSSFARGAAFIGQASIAIFVAHTLFAAGLRYALYKAGFYNAHLHVGLETVAGILMPAALFLFANVARVAPVLGLGQNQRHLAITGLSLGREPLPERTGPGLPNARP